MMAERRYNGSSAVAILHDDIAVRVRIHDLHYPHHDRHADASPTQAST
jgi:hypothetical protein